VLPFVAWLRRRATHDPRALRSHALTGATVSAVAWMAAGYAIGRPEGYRWFWAAAGVGVGLLVWLAFYLLSADNQPARTWGALNFAGLALLFGGQSAAMLGLVLLARFGWDTCWRRWRIPRMIKHAQARAAEAEAVMRKQTASLAASDRAAPSPQQREAARLELIRVKAMIAAASGTDFAATAGSVESAWWETEVPKLKWLRAAALAGRWQVSRGAVKEVEAALDRVEAQSHQARP
jgi:hypothetical protein